MWELAIKQDISATAFALYHWSRSYQDEHRVGDKAWQGLSKPESQTQKKPPLSDFNLHTIGAEGRNRTGTPRGG